jgi:DEAD/DEAH box helicase domain-containing protein
MNMSLNFVYFDLETEHLAEEVGGWSNIEQLGMAVAVTMHSRDDSFHVYRAGETPQLLADLRTADCVVGFNSRGFDFRVLQPYVDFNVKELPNLDLMLDIKKAAGFRVGLNNACGATLGESKSGDGTDSVQWWREGKHNEVIEYCKQDVLLTRRLHEYGARHHQVFCKDKQGRKRTVAVPWSLDGKPVAPAQGSLF